MQEAVEHAHSALMKRISYIHYPVGLMTVALAKVYFHYLLHCCTCSYASLATED